MISIDNLIQPLQECDDAVLYLLNLLPVKITKSTLRKDLSEHPDYPSMLAIKEVISKYGVDSLAIRIPRTDWDENLQPPFLAYLNGVNSSKRLIVVVTNHSDASVEYYDPRDKKIKVVNNSEFDKQYSGTLMAVASGDNAGEKEFSKNNKIENEKKYLRRFSTLAIPMLAVLACLFYLKETFNVFTVSVVVFTMLTLLGCAVAVILLLFDLDKFNPVVRKICQSSKKVNCSAVLSSKASKLFGLSWSTIGLVYFLGMLLALLSGSFSVNTLVILSWVNLLALPYIFFSVYYQWKVVKQWCKLCLFVQAILALQFATGIAGGFLSVVPLSQVPFQNLIAVSVSFVFTFISAYVLVPALQQGIRFRQTNGQLQKLKHNPQIFHALLDKQDKVTDPNGLGIMIGNPDAQYKITKVCNPYCGPCAEAHPVIEELLKTNSNIQLEIIFAASETDINEPNGPIKHLLAIADKNDPLLTANALDDWYNAPKKNYEAFAEKYGLGEDFERQNKRIESMIDWCKKSKISYTPTIFINNNLIPELYSVNDLKYFL